MTAPNPLLQALASIVVVVAFRGLPLGLYVLGSRRYSRARRTLALLGVCSPLIFAHEIFIPYAAVIAYFAVATLAYLLIAGWPPLRRSGWLRFALAASLFLALPGALAPAAVVTAALVWGWEMMLSAYSFAVEAPRGAARARYASGVFFVLVDPTLVWVERSVPEDVKANAPSALWRIGLGAGAMFAHELMRVIYLATAVPVQPRLDQVGSFADYVAFTSYFVMRAAGMYLTHSGLASIQIGMMRLAGFRTPERYRYAFLARDPQDFWLRFNTWVGAWARRYLYFPAALGVGRSFRELSRSTVKTAALFATFASVGVLHDMPEWVSSGRFANETTRSPFAFTIAFAIMGLLFFVWLASAHLGEALGVNTTNARPRHPIIRWLVFQQMMLLMVWLCFPYIEHGQPPAELANWAD